MNRTLLFPATACICLIAGIAAAAPKPVDISEKYPTESWNRSGDVQSPGNKGLSPMGSERFEISEWPRKYSSMGQQRADFSTGNDFSAPIIEYDTLEREVQKRTFSPYNRQSSNMHNLDREQERSFVDKYEDAPIGRLESRQEMIHDMVEGISMQDFNRFQFRNTHSTQEGLAVKSAGGTGRTSPLRTMDGNAEGQSYLERANTFFETSRTSSSGQNIPQSFMQRSSNSVPSSQSSTRQTQQPAAKPPPMGRPDNAAPASAPKVERGEMKIEARVLD